jgi:hypothetical protein
VGALLSNKLSRVLIKSERWSKAVWLRYAMIVLLLLNQGRGLKLAGHATIAVLRLKQERGLKLAGYATIVVLLLNLNQGRGLKPAGYATIVLLLAIFRAPLFFNFYLSAYRISLI